MMADEDLNVRMPMGDRGHDAEIRSDDGDERWGENESIDDIGEEDEEESDDDDGDDDNDDSISDDEVIEDEIVNNWGESEGESDDDDDDDNDRESESDEEIDEDEILEAFLHTFHKGDYDKEFDDALCLDRSLLPPAQSTQASYHKPDNWGERNRIGLEEVQRQLRSCIGSVSLFNSLELKLSHNGYGDQLMDNEEPIVWHESILEHYWDQLEAKINEQDIEIDIRKIQIENVEITKECLAVVVQICRCERVNNLYTSIVFCNANLCDEGIVFLSKLVDVSFEFNTLIITHNRIDNMESAYCLSRSLRANAFTTRLHLSHCDLGSNPEILLVILQSDISHIDLRNNNIDSLGAVIIADYLEGDPPIEHLLLGHNRLNDHDAILISQALKKNRNLRTIHIYSNNLSSIGVNALLNSVFDSSSLNALSESNHTLTEMDFFNDNNRPFSEGANCIENLLHLDRTQKILFALQDKDSLLKYLANVPVGLMPQVMAFPLRQDDNQLQQKYLNVLYFTMRWWNMPMLYSYHRCCVKSDTKRKRR
jgi:hypothetical protein